MADDRADPFDISDFLKPAIEPPPAISKKAIREVSEAAGFPSRQAPTTRSPRRRRRATRNVQFNLKLSQEEIDRFRGLADKHDLLFGELFERMLDAFDRT